MGPPVETATWPAIAAAVRAQLLSRTADLDAMTVAELRNFVTAAEQACRLEIAAQSGGEHCSGPEASASFAVYQISETGEAAMPKRKPKKLPIFLAAAEPEQLLGATCRERDRLLLLVLLLCGLRVSELTALRVEHLDFPRRVLWVREGKGKKDRAIPMPRRLVAPLRGWVGARREGYLFPSREGGGRMTARSVQLLLKRLAVKAGLHDATSPRRVTPHKLRHAFCTRLLESGAPIHEVRDLMGHSSIAATDRYAHCTPERLRAAIDRPYA